MANFCIFCCRAAGSEQQVIECFCQRSLLLRLVVVHWLSQYFRLGGLAVIFHRLAQLQGFFGLALAGLRCPCVQLLPEIQQLVYGAGAPHGKGQHRRHTGHCGTAPCVLHQPHPDGGHHRLVRGVRRRFQRICRQQSGVAVHAFIAVG